MRLFIFFLFLHLMLFCRLKAKPQRDLSLEIRISTNPPPGSVQACFHYCRASRCYNDLNHTSFSNNSFHLNSKIFGNLQKNDICLKLTFPHFNNCTQKLDFHPEKKTYKLDCGEKYPVSFTISYECVEFQHGPNCTYCRPRDDSMGHFTCDEEGNTQCLPGWRNEGNYCMEAICSACDNGLCVAPNTCKCFPGYEGEDCSICKPKPSCMNGFCYSAGDCICYDGWTGHDCQQSFSSCLSEVNSCVNGGICVNITSNSSQCRCTSYYIGNRCEFGLKKKSNGCQNGGLPLVDLESTFCRCKPPFSNKKCNNKLTFNHCNTSQCLCDTFKIQCSEVPHIKNETNKKNETKNEDKKLALIISLGIILPILTMIFISTIYGIIRIRKKRLSLKDKNNIENSFTIKENIINNNLNSIYNNSNKILEKNSLNSILSKKKCNKCLEFVRDSKNFNKTLFFNCNECGLLELSSHKNPSPDLISISCPKENYLKEDEIYKVKSCMVSIDPNKSFFSSKKPELEDKNNISSIDFNFKSSLSNRCLLNESNIYVKSSPV